MPPFAFPRLSPGTKKEATADDDDYTLYSDKGSIYSRSNASTSSFRSYNQYDELPAFRLSKAEGDKAVYEAWTVYLPANYDEPIFTRKLCGVTAVQDYDSYPGVVSSISELYDQEELMDMHLKSIEKYQSKRKRAWPSRVVRGTASTYEDEVDARIRKLPNQVQSEICRLLADREESSSNRFHNRPWTVVMMQEQLHRRFADANPKVIDKRHRVRFWKNPGKNDRSEYFVIIRGQEGRPIEGTKGQCEFKRFDNPWHFADEAEARRRTREERRKIRDKRRDTMPPPSYRYTPPAPPPLPTFPRGSMYSAPGAYSRQPGSLPRVAVPPAPAFSAAPAVNPYARPYPQPPPAPTPPVSYPPPPPVQWIRGSGNCFGGPKYPASAPLPRPAAAHPSMGAPHPPPPPPPPPPAAPRTSMYGPPPGFQPHSQPQPQSAQPPRPNPFGSYSAPYTMMHCGGSYNGMQSRYPAPPPLATPPPPATRPRTSPFSLDVTPRGRGVQTGKPPSKSYSETFTGVVDEVIDSEAEAEAESRGRKPVLEKKSRSRSAQREEKGEEGKYEGHLCGGDHDDDDVVSDTSSVRSWVWRTRDQRVDAGKTCRNKGDGETEKEKEIKMEVVYGRWGHVEQQVELERNMKALTEANMRRNQEQSSSPKRTDSEEAECSSVDLGGSGKGKGL